MILALTLQRAFQRAVEQAAETGRRQRIKRERLGNGTWWTVREVSA